MFANIWKCVFPLPLNATSIGAASRMLSSLHKEAAELRYQYDCVRQRRIHYAVGSRGYKVGLDRRVESDHDGGSGRDISESTDSLELRHGQSTDSNNGSLMPTLRCTPVESHYKPPVRPHNPSMTIMTQAQTALSLASLTRSPGSHLVKASLQRPDCPPPASALTSPRLLTLTPSKTAAARQASAPSTPRTNRTPQSSLSASPYAATPSQSPSFSSSTSSSSSSRRVLFRTALPVAIEEQSDSGIRGGASDSVHLLERGSRPTDSAPAPTAPSSTNSAVDIPPNSAIRWPFDNNTNSHDAVGEGEEDAMDEVRKGCRPANVMLHGQGGPFTEAAAATDIDDPAPADAPDENGGELWANRTMSISCVSPRSEDVAPVGSLALPLSQAWTESFLSTLLAQSTSSSAASSTFSSVMSSSSSSSSVSSSSHLGSTVVPASAELYPFSSRIAAILSSSSALSSSAAPPIASSVPLSSISNVPSTIAASQQSPTHLLPQASHTLQTVSAPFTSSTSTSTSSGPPLSHPPAVQSVTQHHLPPSSATAHPSQQHQAQHQQHHYAHQHDEGFEIEEDICTGEDRQESLQAHTLLRRRSSVGVRGVAPSSSPFPHPSTASKNAGSAVATNGNAAATSSMLRRQSVYDYDADDFEPHDEQRATTQTTPQVGAVAPASAVETAPAFQDIPSSSSCSISPSISSNASTSSSTSAFATVQPPASALPPVVSASQQHILHFAAALSRVSLTSSLAQSAYSHSQSHLHPHSPPRGVADDSSAPPAAASQQSPMVVQEALFPAAHNDAESGATACDDDSDDNVGVPARSDAGDHCTGDYCIGDVANAETDADNYDDVAETDGAEATAAASVNVPIHERRTSQCNSLVSGRRVDRGAPSSAESTYPRTRATTRHPLLASPPPTLGSSSSSSLSSSSSSPNPIWLIKSLRAAQDQVRALERERDDLRNREARFKRGEAHALETAHRLSVASIELKALSDELKLIQHQRDTGYLTALTVVDELAKAAASMLAKAAAVTATNGGPAVTSPSQQGVGGTWAEGARETRERRRSASMASRGSGSGNRTGSSLASPTTPTMSVSANEASDGASPLHAVVEQCKARIRTAYHSKAGSFSDSPQGEGNGSNERAGQQGGGIKSPQHGNTTKAPQRIGAVSARLSSSFSSPSATTITPTSQRQQQRRPVSAARSSSSSSSSSSSLPSLAASAPSTTSPSLRSTSLSLLSPPSSSSFPSSSSSSSAVASSADARRLTALLRSRSAAQQRTELQKRGQGQVEAQEQEQEREREQQEALFETI